MMKAQRPTNSNRSSKLREKLDFRFSNFQALQVPKGWDRLFVSLISVETGKTIAKLGKALVKNGTCQWTETLSESFHTDTLKGHEDCLVKLLVSSGSTRSNILGETTINVAHYAGSRASAAVSQPLKKCSYGTILQVKVQRLISRSKTGDEESKKSKFDEKDENVDRLDLESVSYKSDNSSDSNGKPLKTDQATTSHSLKLDNKTKVLLVPCNDNRLFDFLQEGSKSASGIFYSSNSQEEYRGRENSSFQNGLKSEEYDSTERKVGGSTNGGLITDSYSVDDDDESLNQPSVNSRLYLKNDFRSEMKPKMNVGSSRKLLEVAEDTIEELRAEAKMWERNARKLMVDLDVSRNELSKLSKKHAEMRMELSAAYAEQDGLKREVEKLQLMANQVPREDPNVHSESLVLIRKELENEIKYQQDMNDDLCQQLKQTQESNVELVSVLQELEETIGEQRIEIEILSSLEFKYTDLEKSAVRSSEENRHLLLQMEQLKGDIELLEKALRDKNDELENERESNREIPDGCNESSHEDLVREMESLREKVDELEKDCTELTDENLELLLQLKNSNKTGIRRCPSFDSESSEHPNVCLSDESVVCDPKFQNAGFESCEHLSEILKQMDVAFDLLKKPWHVQSTDASETNTAANEMSPECIISFLQELNKLLEMKITECNENMRNHEMEIKDRDDVIADARKRVEDGILEVQELEAKSEENYARLMKANVLSMERETNFLLQELETKVSELQQEKRHLEQDMEVQLEKLKDERELHLQETQHFESVAMSLQDETSIQISDLQQKSEDMLQESRKLGDMNLELERENHELHDKCSALVYQLNESKKSLSDCTIRVQLLEDHLTSVVEDFEVKENSLKSGLEELIKEKLAQEDTFHQMMEALIQEVQSESELKVQELTDEISASKQSHKRLNDEHERILKLLACYKRSEEKLKADLNDLELKLTISNYEREQLTKETGILKVQLQNMSGLQDEISLLKSELKECRIDKGGMEIALHTISGDYEELKAENVQLSEKMSFFEGEFEECKRIKLHLEEKLLEMDKDLAAKEILCIQNADLKSEVTEMKRANVQIQQKMYRLEEDRDEWLKKAQALEEKLKIMKERNNIHNEGAHSHDFDHQIQDPHSLSMENMTKRQFLEHESHSSSTKAKNSSVVTRERYERTKSSLETELIELRERYLEMSLKYAEVEGQREDLVMKLKATRGGKRWFL
ncbi:hypothetical protein ACS0TY_015141 [Phlomoides rotata]